MAPAQPEMDIADQISKMAGISIASSRDIGKDGVVDAAVLSEYPGVIFDELGVGVIDLDSEQVKALVTPESDYQPLLVEPERYVYAVSDGLGEGLSAEYLRGYRDAVEHLLGSASPSAILPMKSPSQWDESLNTWGVQATAVIASQFTGKGIRVAILDTGIDAGHPDFARRQIWTQSFVPGSSPHDGHGHGTHCIGIACGTKYPNVPPRYGMAPEADIFAGKVLDDMGRGADRFILNGLNWAVANGCHVVSMSLGAPMQPGQSYSTVFERAVRRARTSGTLVVAAAGNDSRRDLGVVNPVAHPANCPSIMAIGAVDGASQVAYFSNRGINVNGGTVDLVAPGVDVRSSWPGPTLYNTISGTSMATPHVAGVAALYAEFQGSPGAAALQKLLVAGAQQLPLPYSDVGAGMVQAP